MADASTISVLIKARDMASEAFQKVETNAGKMAGGIAKHRRAIGMAMTGMGAAMTGFAVMSVKAASDLEESMNAVNVIFTDGAKVIHEFGENSARSVGLSTAKFNELASVTGALLKDVGLPMEEVAGLTTDLAVRAADMASVMNTSVEDALSAVGQALRGETEAIRRYAGDVTDASLQVFALSEGIEKQVSEMTEQEKRLLRVSLIMEQTNTMAGDFANTSESLANRMRIAKAEFANVSAELGTALLPLVTAMVEKIQVAIAVVADWIKEHPELAKKLMIAAAAVGALMLVLGPLLLILPGLTVAFGLLTTVGLGPIGVAIGLVTAAIIIGLKIWRNWDKIVDVVRKTIGTFTKQVIGFIIKLGEGFLAITKWIPGMGDARRAIEGTMDSLRDAQNTVDEWGQNTGRRIEEHAEAWGEMEDVQMEASRGVITSTEEMANRVVQEQDKIVSGIHGLTQTQIEGLDEVAKRQEEFTEQDAYFKKLNADAAHALKVEEINAREASRDVFIQTTRDKLEAHAREREARERDVNALVESLSEVNQQWKNSGATVEEVMQLWSQTTDQSINEIGAHLIKYGVDIKDAGELTREFTRETGRNFFDMKDDIALALEQANRTVEEKMAGMGRIMSGTSFTSAAGQSLGLGQGGMEQFKGMTASEQVEGITSKAGEVLSGANLIELTKGGGAVAGAAIDLIQGRWETDPVRLANEKILLEGGYGEVDSNVRTNARNRINAHLKLQKRREEGAHLNLLTRDMGTFDFKGSFGQAEAIDIARQIGPQIGGQQGELMRLYATGAVTAFAQGGIVRRPTVGLIGEAGPEAVIPLGRGGNMGATNNFHFHGAVYGVEDLKEAVVEAVRDHAISGGFSGVFAEA